MVACSWYAGDWYNRNAWCVMRDARNGSGAAHVQRKTYNVQRKRACRSVRTDSNGREKKKKQRDVGVQQLEPENKIPVINPSGGDKG